MLVEIPPERSVRDRISERFFRAIEIDPLSPADQRKIRDALRWVETEQESKARRDAELALDRRERRSRNWVFVYAVASTLFGIVATTAAKHFMGGP